jgi:multidrug resistance protein MdtO
LFVAVTGVAAWIATSSPRLSYFGIQLALAFYVVHLAEFTMQTSLAVARDRVAGVLLGLFMMWLVFGQLWGAPAMLDMKRAFVSTLRRLSELVREPVSPDARVAIERSSALREMINQGFDRVRALNDAVLLEFGPDRAAHQAVRHQVLEWQPLLRVVFLTRVALFKYRLGLPGFELPHDVATAQAEFDRALATRLDHIADRLKGQASGALDDVGQQLARLEDASRPYGLDTFLALSRRIASLTMSLDAAVAGGLVPADQEYALTRYP